MSRPTTRSALRARRSVLRRGMRVHKFRIERHLGAGRFADVYRAYDTLEGQRVALKVFALPRTEAMEELFRHEARVAALLEHPNIVRLKSADILAGRFVLVTELAERTLADRLDRPLSVRFALHVMHEVLKGLAHAHERGVIHRDIKPENILVWRDGRVKVSDFGVARFDAPATHTTVTGTPSYRAPEQAYGKPRFASDVFAVALLFYEMVTHVLPGWPFRWPFEHHERLASRVPPKLVHVIRRAASFDLNRRYRDAGTMLAAVRAAVPELAVPAAVQRAAMDGLRLGWREYRQREFETRFGRHLHIAYRCHACAGPISEFMLACPWCGYDRNSFYRIASFPNVCAKCERGVHDDWRYCPWCYGARFRSVASVPSRDPRYGGRCPNPRCRATRLLPHMRHCPWCNARLRPWRSRRLGARCPSCRASVASGYWEFCAWCGKGLQAVRRPNQRGAKRR